MAVGVLNRHRNCKLLAIVDWVVVEDCKSASRLAVGEELRVEGCLRVDKRCVGQSAHAWVPPCDIRTECEHTAECVRGIREGINCCEIVQSACRDFNCVRNLDWLDCVGPRRHYYCPDVVSTAICSITEGNFEPLVVWVYGREGNRLPVRLELDREENAEWTLTGLKRNRRNQDFKCISRDY